MTETTQTFDSPEELAEHLLNRFLPYCSNYFERLIAAAYAAEKAVELWEEHAHE